VIALLAVYFSAMSAALRSSTDTVSGINRRFGSMPSRHDACGRPHVRQPVPRATALATAILCGYLIGFRFYRSAEYTIGFRGSDAVQHRGEIPDDEPPFDEWVCSDSTSNPTHAMSDRAGHRAHRRSVRRSAAQLAAFQVDGEEERTRDTAMYSVLPSEWPLSRPTTGTTRDYVARSRE